MKKILNLLFDYKTLSKETAKEVLTNLANGEYNQSQVAAFLTVFLMRNITVEELEGFREAMLELCLAVDLNDGNVIDLCGTGGDGKDTFNISTLASFVAAGAGVKVAKHGNYGVSSVSGSSNVLEQSGYKFTNDLGLLQKSLDETNICFLHAPMFHPAMKNVAPIRRELGVKTFFNMLGPMVNPAMPKYQMVGVFNMELQRLYGYLYQKLDKRYSIVHALDGYDEVSLTSDVKIVGNGGERILTPEKLGFAKLTQEQLAGGQTLEEAAKIFDIVLKNEGTEAQTNVVLANAALAIECFFPGKSYEDSLADAKESLESLRAYNTFKKLIELSK